MKAKRKKKPPFSYPIDYRYGVVRKITPSVCTVWQIIMSEPLTRDKRFLFWHKDAKIEDIVNFLKVHHPDRKFWVRNISNGDVSYDVLRTGAKNTGINALYRADSRWVSQDWKVSINLDEGED